MRRGGLSVAAVAAVMLAGTAVDDNLVDSLDVGVSGDTLHIGQE